MQDLLRLNASEVQTYEREGWLVPRYRLESAYVAQLQASLDELIRNNPGVRPEKLVSAHVQGDNREGVKGSREIGRAHV